MSSGGQSFSVEPGRYHELRLPIVAQLVVMCIMGTGRHDTDDRRKAEEKKGQPDGTNGFNDLHVRPHRLPHDTSQPTSSFFYSRTIRLSLPDLPQPSAPDTTDVTKLIQPAALFAASLGGIRPERSCASTTHRFAD